MPGTPRHTVRLDVETQKAISTYQERNGMTFSQALRILVALALREEDQSAEKAFRAASFREGVRIGVSAFSESVQDAAKSALDDIESYIREGT